MSSVRWYNASAHYALFLAEGLLKSGVNVTVMGIPDSPFIHKAAEMGIDVIDSINLMNPGLFDYLFNLFKFRKIVTRKNIKFINTHMSRDHVFAFIALIGTGRKIIRTRTDSKPPKKNLFNKMLYKLSAERVIVSSEYMVPDITAMGIDKRKVSVIPLGINYDEFGKYKPQNNLKSRYNILENKTVVSFIGRLDKVKGVEYFIQSYRYLRNKDRFHFLISGEEINITKDELKNISVELNIQGITIIDKADDVRELLAITDIGVIPSIGSESICRIGLEMLSFGIPVVGSNINSIPEMIKRFGGIIVKPGSPGKIASALDYLSVRENYEKIKKLVNKKIKSEKPDRFILEHMDLFSKLSEE